jgi:hypothetical protein
MRGDQRHRESDQVFHIESFVFARCVLLNVDRSVYDRSDEGVTVAQREIEHTRGDVSVIDCDHSEGDR